MKIMLSVIVRILLSSTISACRLPDFPLSLIIDEDKEIIFGDELTIDHIVWMGTQPTLKEKSERVGIRETLPSVAIISYLHKAVQKGQTVHYLPPYRPEHKLKLMDWLGIPPARQEGSVPFIRAVVAQRNYKSAEEIAEIEKGM